ncbi:MAG: 2Fe-2S iron-sulfur cluster binding domain-containing protein [Gammaproteobacteria bacterium]|nr:2Fe-2S iron-sulfur cluster binding domain-containing protein [Gammaproteobacteria bacterium]
MSHHVTLRYADGVERSMSVAADQTVLEAAEANGIPIVSACQAGVCGTCVARCTEGRYDYGQSIGLSPDEKAKGYLLTCQTRVSADSTIYLDYPLGANAARLVVGTVRVERVERLSPTSALLVLDARDVTEPIDFKAGQFADLKVPGTTAWRSYSFAHAAREDGRLEFLIRLLPEGTMSDYLRERAQPGDLVELRAPKGAFHVRDAVRPIVLMAGGTGLSAILAIAEALVAQGTTQPIRLNYGVSRAEDLVLTDRLATLAARAPNFTWSAIVQHADAAWTGRTGLVPALLAETDLAGGECDVYLCGPAPMVDATRAWLDAHGCHKPNLYYEKFVASGVRGAATAAVSGLQSPDVATLRARGKGTAVVLGGSIIGISTAKALSAHYEKVIILEKDPVHRRQEGRNGAAQGWHLHHLLIAGQRQIETLFPGVVDDMVAAGAFKVDMGEQYRLMLGGSWKKPMKSGLDIVCAARPILEWAVRRRVDDEPQIDYRYETAVQDLVLDPATRSIVGVVAMHDGHAEVLPAEFVADCAGKNTPVPGILDRLGIGAPELDEDCINCFYSTMQHRVPPERAWRDKVMVICYAYRPYQEHYCAQFYADRSRTVLITSLVGYNMYRPPRNAEEFREFARLMPSPTIGEELDGLEAISPVYNFRYPTMQRYRYESKSNLPAGLVAVGDALSSADPVSGAGITKGLLELAELRKLLATGAPRDAAFVRDYYREVAKLEDLVWSVIREQNLRYPWIKDVEKKRPFYFGAQNWYIDRILEAMHDDPDIYRRYLEVVQFVSAPGSLLAPGVAARVLGKWLRAKLSLQPTLIERNFRGARSAASRS